MRKQIVVIGLISLVIVALASTAYCDTPIKKLGRGFSNVITSPFEIFEQMKRVNNTDGPWAGMTYGLVKGVAMTVVRAAIGVYEITTFPIPSPKEYKPILTDPEFFFEEMNW